jgi:hypothetical protein
VPIRITITPWSTARARSSICPMEHAEAASICTSMPWATTLSVFDPGYQCLSYAEKVQRFELVDTVAEAFVNCTTSDPDTPRLAMDTAMVSFTPDADD